MPPCAPNLKIGVDLPVSGGDAASNIPTQNGVVLAIGEANAAGLPDGYRLAPYILDDALRVDLDEELLRYREPSLTDAG